MAKKIFTGKNGSVEVEIIDHGLKKIVEQLGDLNKSYVKVGVLSDAGTYQNSKASASFKFKGSKKSNNINMTDLAAIHEFGSVANNIPSRPFMKQSYLKNKASIQDMKKSLLKKMYSGSMTASVALKKLGALHMGQVKTMFRTGSFKPLAESTKKSKGSSRPLIDTGRLRQSIDYEVVNK